MYNTKTTLSFEIDSKVTISGDVKSYESAKFQLVCTCDDYRSQDFDNMEALGIYEVIEEDLALCEYVDVSKHDIQEIVREGLELIQNG